MARVGSRKSFEIRMCRCGRHFGTTRNLTMCRDCRERTLGPLCICGRPTGHAEKGLCRRCENRLHALEREPAVAVPEMLAVADAYLGR